MQQHRVYRYISSAPKVNQYGRPWISYSGALNYGTELQLQGQ
ncbi:BgTH12-07134 [Blumeria graminis f. sp. triticale]|uniref:BgTH12-07134 n=1 Tax=Blumeria graminis f. sp. triticale TaxID=1689686 RepID=A0A9W4DD50_BLUGR|nr:BgTH12-07134 [Blumeria graminis f. sp. triticale]